MQRNGFYGNLLSEPLSIFSTKLNGECLTIQPFFAFVQPHRCYVKAHFIFHLYDDDDEKKKKKQLCIDVKRSGGEKKIIFYHDILLNESALGQQLKLLFGFRAFCQYMVEERGGRWREMVDLQWSHSVNRTLKRI